MTDLMALFNGHSDSEDNIKMVLPWPGNKVRSKKEILPLLPYRDAYIEPFGGTGAILMHRNPSETEVWNDLDDGLTSFYRCLRDPEKMALMIDWLECTVHSRTEWQWCKDTWQQCEDLEKACRWYYVITYSFASLGRNFGTATQRINCLSGKLRDRAPIFDPVHKRMKNVIIESDDWLSIVDKYDKEEAVIYMDPPYVEGDQYAYGAAAGKYLVIDHRQLLDRIFEMRGFVALSGYPNDLYDQYPWDDTHEWMQSSTITPMGDNKDAKTRGLVKEKLWIKE